MISVVVPFSGRLERVQELCLSLQSQVLSEEFEVLIVANPPSLELKKYLQSLSAKFHYFENDQRGANKARNTGVKAARGRYLVFFDDDCVLPHTDFLSKAVSLMDQNSDWLALGGPYRPKERLQGVLATAYYYIQSKWLFEGKTDSGFHRYLIGGNMLIRKSVFAEFGLFNEDLKFGGTETEFFLRLKDQKIQFVADHFVYHDYSLGRSEFLRKAFLQGIGRSYMRKQGRGDLQGAIRYGQLALLEELGLQGRDLRAVALYEDAFQAGELFYLRHGRTRPSNARIRFELLWHRLRNRKNTTLLEKSLRVVDNYRSQNESDQ